MIELNYNHFSYRQFLIELTKINNRGDDKTLSITILPESQYIDPEVFAYLTLLKKNGFSIQLKIADNGDSERKNRLNLILYSSNFIFQDSEIIFEVEDMHDGDKYRNWIRTTPPIYISEAGYFKEIFYQSHTLPKNSIRVEGNNILLEKYKSGLRYEKHAKYFEDHHFPDNATHLDRLLLRVCLKYNFNPYNETDVFLTHPKDLTYRPAKHTQTNYNSVRSIFKEKINAWQKLPQLKFYLLLQMLYDQEFDDYKRRNVNQTLNTIELLGENLFNTLYELAKNIIEHSQHKEGVLLFRKSKGLSYTGAKTDDEKSMICVVDRSSRGIVEALKTGLHNKIEKETDPILNDILNQDVNTLETMTIPYNISQFIDDTYYNLNHFKIRKFAHFGIPLSISSMQNIADSQVELRSPHCQSVRKEIDGETKIDPFPYEGIGTSWRFTFNFKDLKNPKIDHKRKIGTTKLPHDLLLHTLAFDESQLTIIDVEKTFRKTQKIDPSTLLRLIPEDIRDEVSQTTPVLLYHLDKETSKHLLTIAHQQKKQVNFNIEILIISSKEEHLFIDYFNSYSEEVTEQCNFEISKYYKQAYKQSWSNKKNGIFFNTIFFKDSNVIPFQHILKRFDTNKSLSLHRLEALLSKRKSEVVQGNIYYTYDNTHFMLDTGVHIASFVYAQRLFMDSEYTDVYAIELVKKLRGHILAIQSKRKSKDKPLFDCILLVGYGHYSDMLLNRCCNLLGTLENRIKFNYNYIRSGKTPVFQYDQFVATDNTCIFIIEPIATTFRTSNELLRRVQVSFKEPNESFKGIINNIFYSCIYVKPNHQLHSEEHSSITTIGVESYKPDACKLCFPERALKSYTKEKVPMSVDESSVHPEHLLEIPRYFREEDIINPESQHLLIPKDCYVPGHYHIDQRHYLHFIKAKPLFKKCTSTEPSEEKNVFDAWIKKLKTKFEKIKKNQILIISPSQSHESNQFFVNYINEHVFGGGAHVLHYKTENAFNKNAAMFHKTKITPGTKIVFVDHFIQSGRTFVRISNFIKECSDGGNKKIDSAITFFSKADKYELRTIKYILSKKEAFHAFYEIKALSIKEENCDMCKEGRRYETLANNSALDGTRHYFLNKVHKFYYNQHLEKQNPKDYLWLKRSLKFVCRHYLNAYLGQREASSKITGNKASIKGVIEEILIKLRPYEEKYYNTFEFHDKRPYANVIKDLIIKILCQPPYRDTAIFREAMADYLLNAISDHMDKLRESSYFEKTSLKEIIQDHEYLRFYLRRTVLLGLNTVLNEDFLIELSQVYADVTIFLKKENELKAKLAVYKHGKTGKALEFIQQKFLSKKNDLSYFNYYYVGLVKELVHQKKELSKVVTQRCKTFKNALDKLKASKSQEDILEGHFRNLNYTFQFERLIRLIQQENIEEFITALNNHIPLLETTIHHTQNNCVHHKFGEWFDKVKQTPVYKTLIKDLGLEDLNYELDDNDYIHRTIYLHKCLYDLSANTSQNIPFSNTLKTLNRNGYRIVYGKNTYGQVEKRNVPYTFFLYNDNQGIEHRIIAEKSIAEPVKINPKNVIQLHTEYGKDYKLLEGDFGEMPGDSITIHLLGGISKIKRDGYNLSALKIQKVKEDEAELYKPNHGKLYSKQGKIDSIKELERNQLVSEDRRLPTQFSNLNMLGSYFHEQLVIENQKINSYLFLRIADIHIHKEATQQNKERVIREVPQGMFLFYSTEPRIDNQRLSYLLTLQACISNFLKRNSQTSSFRDLLLKQKELYTKKTSAHSHKTLIKTIREALNSGNIDVATSGLDLLKSTSQLNQSGGNFEFSRDEIFNLDAQIKEKAYRLSSTHTGGLRSNQEKFITTVNLPNKRIFSLSLNEEQLEHILFEKWFNLFKGISDVDNIEEGSLDITVNEGFLSLIWKNYFFIAPRPNTFFESTRRKIIQRKPSKGIQFIDNMLAWGDPENSQRIDCLRTDKDHIYQYIVHINIKIKA